MKRSFYIGDIVNLVFQEELFWNEAKSDGAESVVMFMFGIGEERFEEYFEDDPSALLLFEICASSLKRQHPFLTKSGFRASLRSLLARVKRSDPSEDGIETSWIDRQAQLHGEMLEVHSLAYLFIPFGQVRFERVKGMELFSDRPLNTN